MQITISKAGEVRAIYSDALDLAALGPLKIRRASHVEPTPTGLWLADLSPLGGPALGPYAKRADALAAEAAWIADNWRDAPQWARARFPQEIDHTTTGDQARRLQLADFANTLKLAQAAALAEELN